MDYGVCCENVDGVLGENDEGVCGENSRSSMVEGYDNLIIFCIFLKNAYLFTVLQQICNFNHMIGCNHRKC